MISISEINITSPLDSSNEPFLLFHGWIIKLDWGFARFLDSYLKLQGHA